MYRYIRRHYLTCEVIWDTVKDELRMFRDLMIFLESDWRRQWNPFVVATDASEAGWGISGAYWERSRVADVGRVTERSRFKRMVGRSARDHALHLAEHGPSVATSSHVDPDAPPEDVWKIRGDFPEVPAELLRPSLWASKGHGQWQHVEDILVLEARALVKGLHRVACSSFGRNVRQLLLVDNMAVSLAFERRRSTTFRLLIHIRRFSAIALAKNIFTATRWVPSELNSAD